MRPLTMGWQRSAISLTQVIEGRAPGARIFAAG